MNDENKVTELTKIYNDVLSFHDTKSMKLLHLRSIRNFIFHLNEIQDLEIRLIAYSLIKDYLNIVSEIKWVDKDESYNLFFYYITPIGKIYVNKLRFKGFMRVSSFIFWAIILNGVPLLIGLNNLTFYAVMNIFIILVIINVIYNSTKKKVYGMRY